MTKKLENTICEKCSEQIKIGALHICGEVNVKFKKGEGTKEEQAEEFKEDILQPYTTDGKINGKYIKVYGKKNHPKFNKELASDMEQASKKK